MAGDRGEKSDFIRSEAPAGVRQMVARPSRIALTLRDGSGGPLRYTSRASRVSANVADLLLVPVACSGVPAKMRARQEKPKGQR